MNEIQMRKYVNQVVKHGIAKSVAKEIVETAYQTGKGKNIDTYIDYAITLLYGMSFKRAK